MTKTTQETGRSMVEMLGVLAVMGVLSVGGISGYTLAMNKHRANSVAADLMKRAVVISAQRQLGQDASLNGFNNQVGEYELDSTISEDNTNQTFGMTVKDVPQAVCQRILALSEQWKNASIQANCEQEKNNMIFIFNDDLSSVTGSNAGGEGTNTPQEPTCEEGSTGNGCQKCDTTTGEWVADETLDGQACDGGVCWNGACEAGLYCKSTDNSGNCEEWGKCDYVNSGSEILGVPGATGVCLSQDVELSFNAEPSGPGVCYRPDDDTRDYGLSSCDVGADGLYCAKTDGDGRCIEWKMCEKRSSAREIIGVANATGLCLEDSRDYLYCSATNEDGKCKTWSECNYHYTVVPYDHAIVGTPGATASCER